MVEDILLVDNDTKVSSSMMITKRFASATEFSQYIEKHANASGIKCMDLLVDYCMKNEIEIESASTLLTTSLKEKIRVEAEELNLLKRKGKDGKLPI